jgi:hypothetical protein
MSDDMIFDDSWQCCPDCGAPLDDCKCDELLEENGQDDPADSGDVVDGETRELR